MHANTPRSRPAIRLRLTVVFLIATVILPQVAVARETYMVEGAAVGSGVGSLAAQIIVLTAIDCDPSGGRPLCPGGRIGASFLWATAGSVGGALIGGGLGLLFRQPRYGVQVVPFIKPDIAGRRAYGLGVSRQWR